MTNLPEWPALTGLCKALPIFNIPPVTTIIHFKPTLSGAVCPSVDDDQQLQLLLEYLANPDKRLTVNATNATSICVTINKKQHIICCMKSYAVILIFASTRRLIDDLCIFFKNNFPTIPTSDQIAYVRATLSNIEMLLAQLKTLQCKCNSTQQMPAELEMLASLRYIPEILMHYFMYFSAKGDELANPAILTKKSLEHDFKMFDENMHTRQMFDLKRMITATIVCGCNLYLTAAKHTVNEKTHTWIQNLQTAALSRFYIFYALVKGRTELAVSLGPSPSLQICHNLLTILRIQPTIKYSPDKSGKSRHLFEIRTAMTSTLERILGLTVYPIVYDTDAILQEATETMAKHKEEKPFLQLVAAYRIPTLTAVRISSNPKTNKALVLSPPPCLRL